MDSEPIPGAYQIEEDFDHIKSVAEFIEIYEKNL